MRLILGSTSPYKRRLLQEAGFDFTIEDSGIDEHQFHQATIAKTVRVLAEKKAEAIMARHIGESVIIITTDVAGELDGQFLGKPESLEHAQQMIMRYSEREVLIWCGTSVANAYTRDIETNVVKAAVLFNTLRPEMVDQYVREKQPLDKGGAIAIEEIEERGFVQEIHGEYAAIIGISMEFVRQQLLFISPRNFVPQNGIVR